jgi:hypothetical protein
MSMQGTPFPHPCHRCRHLFHRERGERCRCAAFPIEIPEEIWRGDFDHTHPFPEDNGIRFAWSDDVPEEMRQRIESSSIALKYGPDGWRTPPRRGAKNDPRGPLPPHRGDFTIYP